MPRFRGLVNLYGYITVEGNDMYDADEKAGLLDTEEILRLLQEEPHYIEAEVFPDQFPEEV